MFNKHERIHQIKSHINQLLSELRRIEPNHHTLENLPPLNLTLNSSSSLTKISSHEPCLLDHSCPYLSRQQTIFHSTTYHQYKKLPQRKKHLILSPRQNFLRLTCATSTPKHSPTQHILLQPHLTSTPRRPKRTHLIPLKRLLYNNQQHDNDSNRPRHSAKRSVHPRYSPLQPIEENPQWI